MDRASKTQPAFDAFSITPSDSVDFETPARGIYVGSSGNISLVTPKGNTVVLVSALVGTIIPVQCTRVNSTNTTASNLVGLF